MKFGLQGDSESFGEDDSSYPLGGDASRPPPNIDVVPAGSSFSSGSDSAVGFGDTVVDTHVGSVYNAEEDYLDEYFVATQPLTQQSQNQPYRPDMDYELVGLLVPSTDKCPTFALLKNCPKKAWKIGRHPHNDLVLPGLKLSNFHCTLKWNGKTGKSSEVVLADTSSNGTWVNNILVSRGQTGILRGGAAISLGGQPGAPNDWRFTYRDVEGQSTRHMNQIWARYDVGYELGAGTFARVHKCIERVTGDEYAVKIINRSKIRTSRSTEQAIVREISILQRMAEFRHKNIVGLREYFEEDDAIYLILELVKGGDLLTYIANNGRLPEDEVRRMAAQICHAVACVHSQNIAHRDLKPENVMITATTPPNCKVADFGLAKLVDEATYLKTVCGTPAYLAPEVMLRAGESYDNKVDSWSLGVIFFCMLTNYAPFQDQYDPDASEDQKRVYFGTRQVEWDLLSNIGLSDDGMDFLRHLLVEDPRNRKEVGYMLDHHWIAHLVPSDSQFQHPLPLSHSSSTPPTVTDGALACSQSMENLDISAGPSYETLNRSDITIPGLPSVRARVAQASSAGAGQSNLSVQSDPSVSGLIPGAYPKPKEEEVRMDTSSLDFGAGAKGKGKTRGAVRRADDAGPSTSPSSRVPAKRKSNPVPIAGSSPLTSLSDLESVPVPPTSKRKPPTGARARARARRDESVEGARRSGRRPPAAKVPRLA